VADREDTPPHPKETKLKPLKREVSEKFPFSCSLLDPQTPRKGQDYCEVFLPYCELRNNSLDFLENSQFDLEISQCLHVPELLSACAKFLVLMDFKGRGAWAQGVMYEHAPSWSEIASV